MNKKVLTIDGMSCEHCKKSVEEALLRLTGVSEAIVSLEEKQAQVIYHKEQVTEEELIEAVEDAGYEVV
ncbi:heavy-metal-associated domain-containing protein [Listeria sp. PSOL-1]|uniref:heavy-metal-associated domain-containing protein n=1 Tax=Listeria sp. PSOL-1 TaxID=1844999 RepID=UPI0013D2215C|nr:copper ion binding protein [Listeria sp. PSOL-1]